MNEFLKDLTNKPLSLGLVLVAIYFFIFKKNDNPELSPIGGSGSGSGSGSPVVGSSATLFAARIFSALHPSGYASIPDGTDEDELFAAASDAKINGHRLQALKTAYYNAYKIDLLADVQSEVSTEEFNRFVAICS